MQTSLRLAKKNLDRNGFLDIALDSRMDIRTAIANLKRQKQILVLAHYYVHPDLIAIADHVGDSLELALKARASEHRIIVVIGVHFMAETVKVFNPDKKILLPDFNAGCSFLTACPAPEFRRYKEQYPDHVVVGYIKSSAAFKTQCDIICTAANAKAIIDHIPRDTPIIFGPDKHLGHYLKKVCQREHMRVWEGHCMVHETYQMEDIQTLQEQYPEAITIAHPECPLPLLEIADYIGSAQQLLDYSQASNSNTFIVAATPGIVRNMQSLSPEKTFIQAQPIASDSCNDCPHMKLNTLEKLYLCMEYELPEIHLDIHIMEDAMLPLERMMEIQV